MEDLWRWVGSTPCEYKQGAACESHPTILPGHPYSPFPLLLMCVSYSNSGLPKGANTQSDIEIPLIYIGVSPKLRSNCSHRNWQDEHPSWLPASCILSITHLFFWPFYLRPAGVRVSHFSSLYVKTFSLENLAQNPFIKIIFPRQQEHHLMVEIHLMIKDSCHPLTFTVSSFLFPIGLVLTC